MYLNSEVTTEPIVNFIGDDYDAISEVFVASSPNSTTQIKLAFLDQHPIHPNSNIYELPFQASRVYYRNTELGDKFLRKWLSYNVKNKKFYCNICMTFILDHDSVWIHGATYTVKRIYDKIKDHEENCQSHEFAVQTFSQIEFKDRGGILDLLDSSRKKIVSNNREIVARVVDIIIFLAKQNLSFRGKRNENVCDLDIFHELNKSRKNRGNFMELVKLISEYDPVLRLHIEYCSKKHLNTLHKDKIKSKSNTKGRGSLVTFLSNSIIHKIIGFIKKCIQEKISEEVSVAGFFSLEVDSTQDVSVTDQLCVCLRYVNNNTIYERIISIISLENSTGIYQADVITNKLENINSDRNNFVSCSFDGAANMTMD